MILTKEQLEKRLSSKDNVATLIQKDKQVIYKDGKNHFGKNGGHNLTQEEKEIIGTLANLESNAITAEIFGVSEHTARHLRTAQTTISEGRGTARHGYDQELKAKIQERLEDVKLTISERAAERLLKSFNCLTDDKLENCSAKDVSQIANQMSQVMRNVSGQRDNKGSTPNVRVVINKPKEADESSFDIIEMKIG